MNKMIKYKGFPPISTGLWKYALQLFHLQASLVQHLQLTASHQQKNMAWMENAIKRKETEKERENELEA